MGQFNIEFDAFQPGYHPQGDRGAFTDLPGDAEEAIRGFVMAASDIVVGQKAQTAMYQKDAYHLDEVESTRDELIDRLSKLFDFDLDVELSRGERQGRVPLLRPTRQILGIDGTDSEETTLIDATIRQLKFSTLLGRLSHNFTEVEFTNDEIVDGNLIRQRWMRVIRFTRTSGPDIPS
jgi:hypothetical protein